MSRWPPSMSPAEIWSARRSPCRSDSCAAAGSGAVCPPMPTAGSTPSGTRRRWGTPHAAWSTRPLTVSAADGRFTVPDRLGLGLRLDHEVCAAYPRIGLAASSQALTISSSCWLWRIVWRPTKYVSTDEIVEWYLSTHGDGSNDPQSMRDVLKRRSHTQQRVILLEQFSFSLQSSDDYADYQVAFLSSNVGSLSVASVSKGARAAATETPRRSAAVSSSCCCSSLRRNR